ncbi:uncharacterized protein ACBT57_025605 [Dama dama]
MERAPRCARFQPSDVPQKRGGKSCACSLCLPRQSGPGSQGLGGRTPPRCGAPTPFRGPSLSFRWRQSVQVGNSQKLPPIVLRALRPGPYPKQCRLRAPGTDLRP